MKRLKKRAKRFINFVLGNKPGVLGHEWNPKIKQKLRAYAVTSRQPIGNGKYDYSILQITEWVSGEGWDISFTSDNTEKMYSMHTTEVEMLLKGLDKMGYFKFDKDELREK